MLVTGTKKYILYGIGVEAEYFLYQNQDVLQNISFCIDRKDVDTFKGLDVFHIDDVDIYQLINTNYFIVASGREENFVELKKNLCRYELSWRCSKKVSKTEYFILQQLYDLSDFSSTFK